MSEPAEGEVIKVTDDNVKIEQSTLCAAQHLTMKRLYIKSRGEFIEVMFTPDCGRHLIIRDKTRHFCIRREDETIRELRPPTCGFACCEVCEDMKEKLREIIQKCGKWIDKEKIKNMEEYIGRENTVNWAREAAE